MVQVVMLFSHAKMDIHWREMLTVLSVWEMVNGLWPY